MSDDTRAEVLGLLEELQAEGADLTRPLPFVFVASAPNEAIARVLAVRTAAMGLAAEVAPADDDAADDADDAPDAWRCACRVSLVPDVERLVALTALLGRLANELGARLEGLGVA